MSPVCCFHNNLWRSPCATGLPHGYWKALWGSRLKEGQFISQAIQEAAWGATAWEGEWGNGREEVTGVAGVWLALIFTQNCQVNSSSIATTTRLTLPWLPAAWEETASIASLCYFSDAYLKCLGRKQTPGMVPALQRLAAFSTVCGMEVGDRCKLYPLPHYPHLSGWRWAPGSQKLTFLSYLWQCRRRQWEGYTDHLPSLHHPKWRIWKCLQKEWERLQEGNKQCLSAIHVVLSYTSNARCCISFAQIRYKLPWNNCSCSC